MNKICYKLIANIILSRNRIFPLKSEMRQKWSVSPLLFSIVLRVLVTEIRQEKDTEGIQIRKEEVKLSISSEHNLSKNSYV